MKEKEAIKIFLAKSQHGKKTIEKLKKWDKNKNLTENAELIGATVQYAYRLARKFEL